MKINKSNIVLATVLSLSLFGAYKTSDPVNASGTMTQTMRISQANNQKKPQLIKKVNKADNKEHQKPDWFTDGLSKKELKYRHKIAFMESRYEWHASNGKCFGRYQLLPSYLRKNGHLDMSHKNQVHAADNYVHARYHTWHRAYIFHINHGWY